MYDLYPANMVNYQPASYPNFNSFGSEFQPRFSYNTCIPNYPQCGFQESSVQSFPRPYADFCERLPPLPSTVYSQPNEVNVFQGSTTKQRSTTLQHFPPKQHDLELSPSGLSECEVLSENSSDQGTNNH